MKKMESVFVLLVCVGLVAARIASAAQHVVGGSHGWDESADYNSWASGQTFRVGDQLVFKYSSGLHSVTELANEAAYKKCDLGTTLNSMSSGSDVVKLTKPGTRYFACGTVGHCDQGMKVKINVVSADAAPASPSSSGSSSSSDGHGVQPFAGLGTVAGLLAATALVYVGL